MKRLSKGLFVAGSLTGILVFVFFTVIQNASIDDQIFTFFVRRHLRASDDRFFSDDSLKALLCGTSAPVADKKRAQSCVAIFAGGKYYLIDTGPGSSRNLQLWQLQGNRLGAVFLTHFHSDHIGDLGEVNTNAWLTGHALALQVYGGPGVEKVVAGFNEAYSQDEQYRTANSGARILPPANAPMRAVTIPLLGGATTRRDRVSAPIRFGDLTVTAIEVNHEPASPAYGYRFDYHGRSIVISGDTNYHPPLAVAARDADVLIHEAQSEHLVELISRAAREVGNDRVAQILADIQHYHTDPQDAARIAMNAKVRLLVFTHFNPPVSNPMVFKMFYRATDDLKGLRWISGEDGTMVSLLSHSTVIKVETLRP